MCRPILARDDKATPKVSGMFYKAIVHSVLLLFSSKTWVLVTPTMTLLHQLESFHSAATRQILLPGKRRATLHVQTCVWRKCPPVMEAMTLAGVKPILEYIQVRQDTIAQYVMTAFYHGHVQPRVETEQQPQYSHVLVLVPDCAWDEHFIYFKQSGY